MTPQHNSATIIDNMQQQFDIMRTASRQDQYVDWSIRSARLKKLEQLVMDNQSEIITAIHADFGQRPAAETTMLELFPTLEAIRYTQKHGKAWSAKQPVKTGIWFLPARSYIQPQPLGARRHYRTLELSAVFGDCAAGCRIGGRQSCDAQSLRSLTEF